MIGFGLQYGLPSASSLDEPRTQLSNETPMTPPASDALRNVAGFVQNLRNQSRLGLLDTQIGGPRRRPQAPAEPTPDIPSAPGAMGDETDPTTPEEEKRYFAMDEAKGVTQRELASNLDTARGRATGGTFMPTGSSQQLNTQDNMMRYLAAQQQAQTGGFL